MQALLRHGAVTTNAEQSLVRLMFKGAVEDRRHAAEREAARR